MQLFGEHFQMNAPQWNPNVPENLGYGQQPTQNQGDGIFIQLEPTSQIGYFLMFPHYIYISGCITTHLYMISAGMQFCDAQDD